MKRSAAPGAVVFGGTSSALGVARALGRRGISTILLARGNRLSVERVVAATSRYPSAVLGWPSADDEVQARYLFDVARKYGLRNWALIPTGDDDAAMLARNAETLSAAYRVVSSPWSAVEQAYDKRLTYRLAAEVGVAHPWTFYPVDAGEVEQLECAFPVILKPAVKRGYNRFTHAKAWRVENRQQLLRQYREAWSLTDAALIMVQELIPGGGEAQFSFAALCRDGQVLASVVARRTRQFPVDFGLNSTFVQTVEEPGVEIAARRLLAALRYSGPVEVEFKRDPRSGEFKVLDINPRLWAWHTLGARAGVDFSYLLWRLAQGQPIAGCRGRSGVAWINPVGDACAGLAEMRRGRLRLRDYARSLWGMPLEQATFALDDPLAGLVEAPLLGYLLAKPAGLDERAWLRSHLKL